MNQKVCSTILNENGTVSLKFYMGFTRENSKTTFNSTEEIEYERRTLYNQKFKK